MGPEDNPMDDEQDIDAMRAYYEAQDYAAQIDKSPCPVSYSHLPHDHCDGKPNAPRIGEPRVTKGSP